MDRAQISQLVRSSVSVQIQCKLPRYQDNPELLLNMVYYMQSKIKIPVIRAIRETQGKKGVIIIW